MHRELFVDDFLIDKMTGTSLRQQLPKDEGTVLKFDAPWEGAFCAYLTVIHADDKYQMWYRGAAPLPQAEFDRDACDLLCRIPGRQCWLA